jgi:prepilin-type N-terminal cleavage/methylation domain-containing protein
MLTTTPPVVRRSSADERGFSLIELMVSVGLLLIVTSVVTSGLLNLSNSQRTISNRTQLHAGVRSATELLQQEVGQAGRVALPGTTTLSAAVVVGATTVGLRMKIDGATCGSNNVSVACVSGVFVGEWLVIDGGSSKESVQVTNVDTAAKQITVNNFGGTAGFALAHAAGAAVNVIGGFSSGIVPDRYCADTANCATAAAAGWVPYPNGSDGTHLKLFGDINGDGLMQYVEYTCDTAGGNLYRNTMSYDAAAKPALTGSQVLLGNITGNPNGTPCFTYMPSPLQFLAAVTDTGCNCTQSYVLDVAITLTVNTQQINPITRKVETETKALLNVSPRNVFNVWQMATVDNTNNSDRIQPMPASVKALLPCIDHC